jgi:hypothetical protein
MATTINYNVGAVDKNSERFNMHAWVSRDHVRMASLNGSVTFAWIYQNRPNHYRYAIAGQWDVANHNERMIVWDLHEAELQRPMYRLFPPKPKLIMADLDAAITATSMLYDQE